VLFVFFQGNVELCCCGNNNLGIIDPWGDKLDQ